MAIDGAFAFDTHYFALSAIVTVAMQFSFFIVAGVFHFDKVTDFAYGANFVLLAVLFLVLNGTYALRQIILAVCISLWGIRIAGYLLMRILKIGEDHRFDERRNSWAALVRFWSLQAVGVWVIFLPYGPVFSASGADQPALGVLDYIGIVIFAVGLLVETVADQTKFSFRNNPANKGHWCDVGVWSWSRHPNYFGEIAVWIGLFIAAIPVIAPLNLWGTIASPLLIAVLLIFVSGVPLLEKSSDKRYGAQREYRAYLAQTSPLIPCPPGLYRALSAGVKRVFCFEYDWFRGDELALGDTPPPDDVELEVDLD